MKRYYFDYAAATPVDPAVEKAMRPYWSKVYGNPGALHWFGQEASAAVFAARDRAAKILGCHYKEIIFTGSATEANNLALRGLVKASGIKNPKIIISAIEHESILETAKHLENEGIEAVYLPAAKSGIVDLKKIKFLLDERTVLVSVMYANNEIGTIQPIKEIAKIVSDFRKLSVYPLFHTDAVQAFNYLDCDVQGLGINLLTLSSQKIYGPKGIGLLYIRNSKHEARNPKQILNSKSKTVSNFDIRISDLQLVSPIVTGGGQESGLRGGTEAVPLIIGFVKALELAASRRTEAVKKAKNLQEYFWSKIKKIAPAVELNGDLKSRLPNNLNLYFPGSAGQELLIKLDLAGFAVSPGAACSARICQPSHVLKALGYSDERATGSLRITFGRPTEKPEVDKLLSTLKKIVVQ